MTKTEFADEYKKTLKKIFAFSSVSVAPELVALYNALDDLETAYPEFAEEMENSAAFLA